MRSAELTDPYVNAENDNRSAQNIHIETMGKYGVAMIVATGLMAVTLSALAFGYAGRAMDRSQIAEREARIAQDKYQYVQSELAKRGIFITTDGH